MNVGPTFEANAKTTEVVKPRMSTFDNPAEFSQTTAVFCPAPGNHRLDAALAKFLAMRLGVIATVCVDNLGFLKRPATYAANRWNGVDQWQQLGDASLRFAPVRIALTGTPLASTRMWCLEPGRARSVGFGPVFRPPQRLAQMKSRRLLVRNLVRLPRVTLPEVARAIASTRWPSASRATVSSRLNLSQIPTLSIGRVSEYRS